MKNLAPRDIICLHILSMSYNIIQHVNMANLQNQIDVSSKPLNALIQKMNQSLLSKPNSNK